MWSFITKAQKQLKYQKDATVLQRDKQMEKAFNDGTQ